ncbi:MAG: MFS transporter [Bacteroidales bacterium]|nr:MFS transporter [Bacteroidales bacterium]
MAGFFAPPKQGAPVPENKIDKVFKSMRFRVFMGSFVGYAAYYLVRKNLSLASADMIAEGLIDKQGVGIAASAVSIAYAFSKFIMGTLSDRSDARKFLTVGLVLASLVMMAVGFLPFSTVNMGLNVALLFAIMLVVGVISGMGWPPCGRIMAYWFSNNERSFKMSLWNTSHTFGSGTLGIIAIFGVGLFADMGIAQPWRANFIIPSMFALLLAAFCWWALRDTPESCGLPSVADWRNDHSGVKTKEKVGEKVPFKTQLFDYVLKNKWIWMIAFANAFVYLVRYGIGDWAPTYLQESGIMTAAESKMAFSVHNYVGALGTVVCGWISSRFFKGRCAPPNIIFMCLVAVGCLVYWQVPAIAAATGMSAKTLVYISLIIIGFCIYGPVALVSIQALNLVPKNAAGTAAGFVGLSGYLIGDSLLSKIIVGSLADKSWDMANMVIVAGAVLGIIICFLTLRSEKKAETA